MQQSKCLPALRAGSLGDGRPAHAGPGACGRFATARRHYAQGPACEVGHRPRPADGTARPGAMHARAPCRLMPRSRARARVRGLAVQLNTWLNNARARLWRPAFYGLADGDPPSSPTDQDELAPASGPPSGAAARLPCLGHWGGPAALTYPGRPIPAPSSSRSLSSGPRPRF